MYARAFGSAGLRAISSNRWSGQPGSHWFPMIPARLPTPIYQSCGSMGFALYVNGGPTVEMLRDIWCTSRQVAWTAYLSTLSHVPIVDVDDLGNKLLETQNTLFDALPQGVQDQASQAAAAARQSLRNLPSLESLLSPGQHYGLELSIPKRIEIRSPRLLPASLSLQGLFSFLGDK